MNRPESEPKLALTKPSLPTTPPNTATDVEGWPEIPAPPVNRLDSLVPSLRILIGLSITGLIIVGLYFGRNLLIPLALAIFLGFLLDPAVTKLKQWGMPRMLAVLTVMALSLGLLVSGATYLGMQLSGLSQQLPTYQNTIQEKLQNIKTYAQGPSVWDGAISTFSIIQQTISGTHSSAAINAPPTASSQGHPNEPPQAKPSESVQQVQMQADPSTPMDQVLDWINAIASPVATAGIVLLFVILILLDRNELRDRILRMLGSNLNVATDTLDEASERIGTYLRMQLIVNVTYGLPMALGLWVIGVPAALMWGMVAVVMRFVPYVGPMISSIFPLALAFAVDPTWNMVLWTLALIAVLELISNNVIEPWLYGSSTGLSTLSVILAATFWTAIWGPIGLILSTPLTACLLVLAHYIPALKFIEVLIGNAPVLDASQRFYQRLLADDVEEAVELANDYIDKDLPAKPDNVQLTRHVNAFYDDVAIPAMRLFCAYYNDVATAEHRLRMNNGLNEFVQQMGEDYPSAQVEKSLDLKVLCMGARWDIDSKVSVMLTHALQMNGISAHTTYDTLLQSPRWIEQAQWEGLDAICVSCFNPEPMAQIRLISRRIKQHWPEMHIIVALWSIQDLHQYAPILKERFGITAVVNNLHNLLLHLPLLQEHHNAQSAATQAVPSNENERLEALHASGVLSPTYEPLYQHTLKQIREAFDVDYAQIAWVDAFWVHTPATALQNTEDEQASSGLARAQSICTYVVYEDGDVIIDDLSCDPRFASNQALLSHKIRFYAGVPLRDKKGLVLGSLSIMDAAPKTLHEDDLALLHQMADDLMLLLKDNQQVSVKLEELQHCEPPKAPTVKQE